MAEPEGSREGLCNGTALLVVFCEQVSSCPCPPATLFLPAAVRVEMPHPCKASPSFHLLPFLIHLPFFKLAVLVSGFHFFFFYFSSPPSSSQFPGYPIPSQGLSPSFGTLCPLPGPSFPFPRPAPPWAQLLCSPTFCHFLPDSSLPSSISSIPAACPESSTSPLLQYICRTQPRMSLSLTTRTTESMQ